MFTQRWVYPYVEPVNYVNDTYEQGLIRLTFFSVLVHLQISKIYLGRAVDHTSIGVENLNATITDHHVDSFGFLLTFNGIRYSYLMCMYIAYF